MSFFLGGGAKIKAKPQFTGLAVQTAVASLPIPLCWGKNRLAPNIIWQGEFQSHKHTQKSGKGGSVKSESYTYSASYQLGLCRGVIVDITNVWVNQSTEADYTALGFELFTGTTPQTPWGHLGAGDAFGYSGIAHIDVANYDLGDSNSFPQHSFEVEFARFGEGYNASGLSTGADPADIIDDFLSNTNYGVGFNTGIITNLFSTGAATTTGDSAYQTYCRAIGFSLSPVLQGQEPARETLLRWAELTNTAIVWTGYELKFHPYGSDDIANNGVTYLANFPVRYTLTDADFVSDREDPIIFDRSEPSDAYNSFSLIIADRDNEYNDLPVSWRDQGLVDQYGLREEENFDAKEVTEAAMANIMVGLIGQRRAYVRNTYSFSLGPEYSLLEAMDVVTCVDERLGTFDVLLIEVSETDDGVLDIIAEEWNGSVTGSVPSGSSETPTNTPINTLVTSGPVNPPIIFEPPQSLSGTPQVWAAVSGGIAGVATATWGGANVWLSTDGVTYNQIGVAGLARQGILSANLATYGGANPDTVNTMRVNLAMSASELEDANTTDAANGVTVCYVESASGYELISYEDVTLTSAYNYDITDLYRAMFGSTVAAHTTGQDFARLDDNIFKYDLPVEYVGTTIYLKFQSFNIFNSAVQDLSAVTAYPYVVTGLAFGTGTAGVPVMPVNFAASASGLNVFMTWDFNPVNDNILSYQIWRDAGPGGTFGAATLVGTVSGSATEYTDSSVDEDTDYTYFLVATNAAGSSTNTAGIDVTTNGILTGQAFGFAWMWPDPIADDIVASFDTPIAFTLPVNIPNSQGTVGLSNTSAATAPSAQTDFDIQSPAGSSIGTMRFAASSLTATFIMASPVSVPVGQPIIIVAPANLNGMAGTLFGSIKGTR
jgi:hypothetical protein